MAARARGVAAQCGDEEPLESTLVRGGKRAAAERLRTRIAEDAPAAAPVSRTSTDVDVRDLILFEGKEHALSGESDRPIFSSEYQGACKIAIENRPYKTCW